MRVVDDQLFAFRNLLIAVVDGGAHLAATYLSNG